MTLKKLPGYGKIYNVGHARLGDIFSAPVVVEEKIDGSQFSFGLTSEGLSCRSRNKEIDLNSVDSLFRGAVETAQTLCAADKLVPGWVYRGEAISKPKHNSLTYERVPKGNFVLYDVDTGGESYLGVEYKREVAERLGLELAPCYFYGMVGSLEELQKYLDRAPLLGGKMIEGVVAKSLTLYDEQLAKPMRAKLVREDFRELHEKEWGKSNPSQTQFLDRLAERYASTARWDKAIQHLRDDGELEGEPRDIGKLIAEVKRDFIEECQDDAAKLLFQHFQKQLVKSVTVGLPEYYKDKLAEGSFR